VIEEMRLFEQLVVLRVRHMASGPGSSPSKWTWDSLDLAWHAHSIPGTRGERESVAVVASSGNVLAMEFDSERVAALDRIRGMLDVMQGLVQEIRAEAFDHPDMGDVSLLVLQAENLIEHAQRETYAAVERDGEP
jgi:hypothetical protein